MDGARSGGDIWGANDRFNYVYQQTSSSNFAITARLINMSITNGWTKVGVMIRGSLTRNSYYYAAENTGGNGRTFQGQDGTGSFNEGSAGQASPRTTGSASSTTTARSPHSPRRTA